MPPFLLALVKINLVIGLFVAVYYLVLRRLTYYTVNRYFLLFGIVFAGCYPWMDISLLFEGQENKGMLAVVPELTRSWSAAAEKVPPYAVWAYGVFFTGFAWIVLRLLQQAVTLYRIHQYSEVACIEEHRVRLIGGQVSAFSFGRNIYINPALHDREALPAIVAHEQVHVRQWHTLDILLVELGLLFYWFNPVAWLLRKAVKENLEYMADRAVLEQGTDKRSYQYSLLQVTTTHARLGMANEFNLVDLKQRIRMMNRKRSSRLALACYILTLPLLVAGCLLCTVNVKGPVQQMLQLTTVAADVQPVGIEEVRADGQQVQAVEVTGRDLPRKPAAGSAVVNRTADRNALIEVVVDARPARGIKAQSLSPALQQPLYEAPSTAFIRPGQPIIAPPGDHRPGEVVVQGYPTRRVQGIQIIQEPTQGTAQGVQPERVVRGYSRPRQ